MEIKINGLKIKGISSTVPHKVLSMVDFYESFGEKEIKRIVMSTGIESVHVADKNIKTSDLYEKAAKSLFEELEIAPTSIDGIIFISQTPDVKMPATSCILQQRLRLKNEVVAFDINYGCSGYIYGLYQAALLIKASGCKRVLLCAGDTITHHLNPQDHKVQLIFGDAATATIIEQGTRDWAFDIRTDGSGYNELIIPKNNLGHDDYMSMNGGAIMEFALREVVHVFHSTLGMQGWERNGLSQVILHQANKFILDYLRKKIDVDKNIVPIEVKNFGNTGSASIPLTLCKRYFTQEHELGKAVLIGFGAGLSWGACALDLSGCHLMKIMEY